MQLDDKIIGLNDTQIQYFNEFVKLIPKYKNQDVIVRVVRNNDTLPITVSVPEEGLIGAYPKALRNYYDFEEVNYSFLEAIPAGVARAYKGIGDYIKQLKLLFSPETKAYKSVGGFITIGSIFPPMWDWESFWRLTAF